METRKDKFNKVAVIVSIIVLLVLKPVIEYSMYEDEKWSKGRRKALEDLSGYSQKQQQFLNSEHLGQELRKNFKGLRMGFRTVRIRF